MERRNEEDPISAFQKNNERQKLKMRNPFIHQRHNLKPDTIGLEENIEKHDINDIKNCHLRIELSNQKITNQHFLFKSKFDLNGKLLETNLPFKDIAAFERCLESTDELHDDGSIIAQEADNFIETDF